MIKRLLTKLFGIHFHDWDEVEVGDRTYRFCACSAVQIYNAMGTPGVGIESWWEDEEGNVVG